MPYNILNCANFGNAIASTGFAGIGSTSCIKARLGLVILFFITAIVNKWGGEEMGIAYSLLFGLIGGLGTYLVLITLFGSLKVAMIFGLLAMGIAGYVGGGFTGE